MKKFYFLFFLFSGFIFQAEAQDPNFSQFFFKEAYYNPAFTGINPGFRSVLTNRQFWTNIPGTYTSSHFMAEFYDVKFLNGAFGLNVMSASKGEAFLVANQVGLQYAKRIGISRDMIIQLGISGAYGTQNVRYSNLVMPDQLDPRLGNIFQTEFIPPSSKNKPYFDFSAGVVSRFNIMQTSTKPIATNNVGIAFFHLNEPDNGYLPNSKARLPLKVNAQWYSVIRVNRNSFYNSYFLLAPGMLYENQKLAKTFFKSDQSGFKTLSFGLNAVIPSRLSFMSQLYTGVWIRKQFAKNIELSQVLKDIKSKSFDAVIYTLGIIKYSRDGKQNFRVCYSYDMTISNATLATGGTHEITLAVEIHNLSLPKGGRSWGYVHHPADRFFNIGTGR